LLDIQDLKQYIIEENKIPDVLSELGCHSIKHKDGYYQCANPDGDNQSAISVYESEALTAIDYTRDILHGKKSSDLFDLVQFIKECSFSTAIKYVCAWVGVEYYHDFNADKPNCLVVVDNLLDLIGGQSTEEQEVPLKPITETILNYYPKRVNDLFLNDGINYETQDLFEIGYDQQTNRITIPIRDEIGNLIGVKGRLFGTPSEDELKYVYLEPAARSKILYGLYKTVPYIKKNSKVYVGEAEKSVLQMWSMGICNCVATGGKKVSRQQIEMLTRLCADVVFLFDKDVGKSELMELADKFVDGVNVYATIDNKNILDEKEAPTDNPEKFKQLLSECLYKIK
jgi:DNA primase